MKSFYKEVSLIVLLFESLFFLSLFFPCYTPASEVVNGTENKPLYLFFSDLPSIKGEKRILKDNLFRGNTEIFLVQEELLEEDTNTPVEPDKAFSNGNRIIEKDSIDDESTLKDVPTMGVGETDEKTLVQGEKALETPTAREGGIDKDPFADEGGTDEDPFADEGDTDKDPFADEGDTDEDPFAYEDKIEKIAVPAGIPDNAEGFNRSMFSFNDKMYFWVLKPVSQGYGFIMPEVARIGVRNFFDNLKFPVRFVNCLFQGKVTDSGVEIARFSINTTVGILGFIDIAEKIPLEKKDEDLDQTLAVYGFGTGTYLTWPFWGPSSVRGTFGLIGDLVFNPATYLPGAGIFKSINNTSLTIGDYEALKDGSLDPYVAIRDAYYQNRLELIKN